MSAPPPDDVIVSTPERVSFSYELAGLGTRFLAQLIDLLALFAVMAAVVAASVWLGSTIGSPNAGVLFFVIVGFAIFFGYFPVAEAIWSGQTLGKLVMNLRVVGDHGEPIAVGQAVVRNLVRIVDFLPVYYAIGVISMFISKRGKRLGDLAAGTIVVKEGQAIGLKDLAAAVPPQPSALPAPQAAPVFRRWTPRLEPRLRRFVVAYARQRHALPEGRKAALAAQVEPALRQVLPEVVTARGPLAALDQLADSELAS